MTTATLPLPDLTAAQARARVNLPRSTFWREAWVAIEGGILKAVKWGRTYRFDAPSVEAWRASRLVQSRADLRRLADGRRRAC